MKNENNRRKVDIIRWQSSCLSELWIYTRRGWQPITVREAKEGGGGEGLTWREWRLIKGTPTGNCHSCLPKGYIGGQKFSPDKPIKKI